MITFEHVTKQFPDGTIGVDDLNLEIADGSFTVFVGPSGCGKTTSMRMINRMIDPTDGVITVGGEDIRTVRPTRLRLGIGYVIQNAGLMPHRTVVDNVATVLVLQGTPKRKARIAALEAMERVGLDLKMATRYPAQLSGGQQQRVGVARALAADPPILLMDEPFSAVDPVVRDDLQREMLRLQSELKKTIVFVTHDIDEAVRLGDRVAVFGTGGVLQQIDTPENVLTRPANDFVTGLVGRDRGFRAMSFHPAAGLPVLDVETVALGDVENLPTLPAGAWVLAVDDARRPLGWVNATRQTLAAQHGAAALAPLGSLTTPERTLRQSLDAVLSSPSEQGVVVDDGGRLLGVVTAPDVLAALARQKDAAGDDVVLRDAPVAPADATQDALS
ncbi:ATP-binding cassette domain-containing protein [Litorihabitans aurantiacus]|uniref:ABC-type quaternary amine transporter n=1 Tax=Litorihabitans aurantiacus TaxID=1930061 RepID=A0AA37XF96_9MICO|nr:ATP-binding cassette domain-containing protein [Litorihabitans aurantiacus]GMA32237.1 putative amino acid ABC transporter, ATP-binding protein [Litorihabitans aurantiacus]